jgi:hypothetical protein
MNTAPKNILAQVSSHAALICEFLECPALFVWDFEMVLGVFCGVCLILRKAFGYTAVFVCDSKMFLGVLRCSCASPAVPWVSCGVHLSVLRYPAVF